MNELKTGKMGSPVWVMDRRNTGETVCICLLLNENGVDVRVPMDLGKIKQLILDLFGAMKVRDLRKFIQENRSIIDMALLSDDEPTILALSRKSTQSHGGESSR